MNTDLAQLALLTHNKVNTRNAASPAKSVERVCTVGFGDEETGGFTSKHWEAHRLICYPLGFINSSSIPGQSSTDPVIYTPESTAVALSHRPTKRRRVKRTEEERINYLRADPYVARFEAYHVFCASCDKWIRLRPNSTYCSIPWDAHRKSCLAKKIKSKNVYAVEAQNDLFLILVNLMQSVLYSIRARDNLWLSVNPDNHRQAVQKLLRHHRAMCLEDSTPALLLNQPTLTGPISAPPLTEYQMALAIGPGRGASFRGVQSTLPNSVSPDEGIAQGISESDLAAANYHMPLYTSHTLARTILNFKCTFNHLIIPMLRMTRTQTGQHSSTHTQRKG
ncbi:hypothetical protein M378DRAFT_13898 [Amanita muscaria Koide BX008]|uniref:Uncharacterized protein n=1 Tax=Amanita muscaria (strain Koide BX008) TaxID=946122 RepID=A0A0C2T308_AMAMK|nr:hypothetical protein M378DRAFT_13898 [Amanita muscaria Koide BX008]